jgi:hypothetical protein
MTNERHPGFTGVMEAVHRALRGEVDVGQAAGDLGVSGSRLALYAGFVRQHVRTAVEKNHSVLAALLRGPTWEALVDGYFRTHPPKSYELNAAAEGFRAFLAAEEEAGRHGMAPFHLELAELEWQEWVAYAHPDCTPLPAEVTQPTLNPTLRILRFDHAVAAFVEAWRGAEREGREDRPAVPDAPAPETVLVFREPASELAFFYRATDALLFALKVAADGLDVQGAASVAGLPKSRVRDLLDRAADIGLIVLPSAE